MENNLREYRHITEDYFGPFARGTRVEELEIKYLGMNLLVVRVTSKDYSPYLIVPGRIIVREAILKDEGIVPVQGQLVSIIQTIKEGPQRERLTELLREHSLEGELNFWN